MRIIFLHFHLDRGGVTSVILNHLRSLDSIGHRSEITVLFGGRQNGWSSDVVDRLNDVQLRLRPLEFLEYDSQRDHAAPFSRELSSWLSSEGYDPDETLIHVHNHSLGKNAFLSDALLDLAESGYRLLLQIHDFAEEFRPANFRQCVETLQIDPLQFGERLYPQGSRIHYAVLNGRDRRILARAGIADDRLHFLPNPVVGPPASSDPTGARSRFNRRFGTNEDQTLLMYPVRGIRRKNIGEAILWSLLPGNAATAITLAPQNPAEARVFERWRGFAEERSLPCVFGCGDSDGLPFEDNLAAADWMLTTSVAEGFGMVFLECWLADRALLGRDLNEITSDFANEGVQFPHVVDTLRIPLSLAGEDEFRSEVGVKFAELLAAYGLPVPSAAEVDRQLDALCHDGFVDFARLPSTCQRRVIESVADSDGVRHRILADNPDLDRALRASPADRVGLCRENRDVVEASYSQAISGRNLAQIYEKVMTAPDSAVASALSDATAILDAFLSLDRLHVLRLET